MGFVLFTGFLYMYYINSQPIKDLGGDQLVYNQLALNILQKRGFSQCIDPPYTPSIQRTPAYPLFLAAVYTLFGVNNYEAVRVIQILLMLGVCVLTFMMALLVYGKKPIAYLSLIICGFIGFDYYTGLSVYSYLLTEPLTIFFVCCVMFFVLLAYQSERTICFILAGVFMGATMLTRPAYLLLPLLIILFMAYKEPARKKILNLALLCVALIIVVLPWSIRNYLAFDRFVPLSASLSGLALFSGAIINNPDFMPYPDADFSKNGVALLPADLEHARNELRQLYQVFNYGGDGGMQLFVHDRELKKIGIKIIREDYLVFIKRWIYRIMGHCRFGDVANILNGITISIDTKQSLKIFLKSLVLLIIALSILYGLKNDRFLLLLLFPLYNMLIYTPFTPQIRYSLPAYPFIIIMFSAGLFLIVNGLHPEKRRARQAGHD